MVQWLGHGTFNCQGLGSGPGQRTKIPQTLSRAKKKNSELISAVNLYPFKHIIPLVLGTCMPFILVLCLIPSEPGLLSSMEIEPFLEYALLAGAWHSAQCSPATTHLPRS